MAILPRYFLRLFVPSFLLCLGIFTGVLLMNYFLRLFSLVLMKGISLAWVASCFVRLLPFFCSLAVPMAFLVALLLTLGQLSERGEIMALRASGFSFREMTWPFLAASLFLSAVLLYVNHKASPDGYHSFRDRYLKAAGQLGGIDVAAGDFMRLGPWRLYAKKSDKSTGRLEGAYLIRSSATKGLRVEAQRGSLRLQKGVGATLELEDGTLVMPNPEPEKFTSARFKRYTLFVPLSAAAGAPRELDIQELSSQSLLERIRDPATFASRRTEYAVEIGVRSASALSPLVFFWIGAPLGLRITRSSKSTGFVLSLGILLLFYGLLALGMGLGRRQAGLAWAAPWLADAVGAAIGFFLTRKTSAQ